MIELINVGKHYFKSLNKKVDVLKNINISIKEGDCIGLVGESGSGKSTLSRLILGLEKPSSGSITIEGELLKDWKRKNKGKMSVVFQDYTSSVNSNFNVFNAISEPLILNKTTKDLDKCVDDILIKVGLDKSIKKRYPHELSGGQLQRVCIARAIATNPKIIILDEAISSLDISTQVQILGLLKKIKDEYGITYLFIAHDIKATVSICDTIYFLYKGSIVEKINSNKLLDVEHEYSKKLIESVISF